MSIALRISGFYLLLVGISLQVSFLQADASRIAKANALMGHKKLVWRPDPLHAGDGDRLVIALHGLGGADGCANKKYLSYFNAVRNCSVIVPHMPYSTRYLKKRNGLVSLAGMPDIIAAIVVIQQAIENGYTDICLYGYSCGAATIINLMYAVQHPDRYPIFKELKVDPQQLRAAITCCILDRPFSSYRNTITAFGGKPINAVCSLVGQRAMVQTILKGLHVGNRVELADHEPLTSAAHITNVPILIHGARKDRTVGFAGPVQIYHLLKKHNARNVALLSSSLRHSDSLDRSFIHKMRVFIDLYC